MRENMSTFYDSRNDYRSYLQHHGVKGMKWGVRHDERVNAARKRKAKKYGVTEKEVDEAKEVAKQTSKPEKGILTAFGGVAGGMAGAMSRRMAAAKAGAKAAQDVIRSGTDRTIRAGLNTNTGLQVFTTASQDARRRAENMVLSSASQIAKIPIGAAAGSAIGYTGGRILEAVIEHNILTDTGLRRNNSTYARARERDVRLKRD